MGIHLHRRCARGSDPTQPGADRYCRSLRRDLPQSFFGLAGHRSLQPGIADRVQLSLPLERVLPDTAFSVFALIYIGLTLATVPLVWVQQDGPSLLVFLFCIVWTGDTAALYVGRNFGRTKLSPRISPNKSWEGSAASLAGSLLIAAALVGWSRALEGPSIFILHFARPLARWLVLAVVLNLFAQVGDLVESAIKRGAGMKDSGAMLPGHGGILDRIDALLLAAPVLWYAQWIQEYFQRVSLR